MEGEAGGGGGGEGDGIAGGGEAEVVEGEWCADASFDVEGGCGGRCGCKGGVAREGDGAPDVGGADVGVEGCDDGGTTPGGCRR